MSGCGFYDLGGKSLAPARRAPPAAHPYNPPPVLPDLALLLALFAGFHWFERSEGAARPDLLQALLGTAAVTLVASVLCRLSADRTERVLKEDGAEVAIAGSRAPMLYPLLAWLAANLAFHWDALVASTVPASWFVLPHVAYFLPLAVTTAAAWIAVDRSAAALDARTPSPRRALGAGLRRNALVLVPIAAILVIHRSFLTLDTLGVHGAGRVLAAFRAFPDLVYLSLAAGAFAAILLAPALVRRALRAVPLEDGPVRLAVARLLAGLGVHARHLLLWPTEGRIQNAMTVGAVARTRCIVLSDGLVASYPLPALLAVVAHEAGHVRRRHLALQAVALLSLVLVFLGAGVLLAPWLPGAAETTIGLLVLWFGWFGLVGRLSRRFEREADVFAAEHAADLLPSAPLVPGEIPPAVAHTLLALRLADRAGGRFFRHGSPRTRMAYLMSWAASGAVREAEVRAGRRTRAWIGALAALAIAMTAARMPATIERGHATLEFADALDLSKDADAARRRGQVAAIDLDRRAFDLFVGVVARADARPRDPELARLGAMAEYDAADRAARGLSDPAGARARLERVLERARDLDESDAALLRFATLIDLARLTLSGATDRAAAVARAGRLHAEAQSLEPAGLSDRYRLARLKLLESAIALRSDDAAAVERARRDLAVQAAGTADDADEWRELADDARAELAGAPAR